MKHSSFPFLMRSIAIPFRLLAALLVLEFFLATAHARFGLGDLPPNEMWGGKYPPIQVGTLRKAPSCTKEDKVAAGMYVMVSVDLYKLSAKDSGRMKKSAKSKGKEKSFMSLKNKIIHGVYRFTFIPGVELGIMGACIGETRTLRIPAALAYGKAGSRRYDIPPSTDIRAVVHILSAYDPPKEEKRMDEFYLDPDIFEEDLDDEPPTVTESESGDL